MSAPPAFATGRRRRRATRPRHRGARLGAAGAHRLLWRAGFGPAPGDIARFAALSRRDAVFAFTRPSGAARLTGAAPRLADKSPLFPADRDGHDHLWWMDRMLRTTQPLVERMTLIFHDWFATGLEKVERQQLMLDQNELLRANALGSFGRLFRAITTDPAMLIWLDGIENQVGDVNENYAREMMELFSLGAGRGAYTEADVRELGRALTGWTADYSDTQGYYSFRFDDSRHDDGLKTIFGNRSRFGVDDAVEMCLSNPYHASFFVTKLWSYFAPVPPSAALQSRLEGTYRARRSIRDTVEAILLSDEFWASPKMVKPPIVFNVGLLRALRRGIDTDAWVYSGTLMGQRLFQPPDVAGWKGRWLDTATIKARWDCVVAALEPFALKSARGLPAQESASAALAIALQAVGSPPLTTEAAARLTQFAAVPGARPARAVRVIRQNALRQLVLSTADFQVA